MSRFWVFCVKMVYVKRVRMRNKVRRYILINLRKCSRRAQCSTYTTQACIDVSRLERLCFHLASVSVSRRAKRRVVSHKPFHSPRWNRLTLDTIGRTPSRRLQGVSSAGRNCATTSRMCAVKESCGYLSASSKTRCILVVNSSIDSSLGITLTMRKSRNSKRHSVSNKSLRNAKEPDC